MDSNAKADLKCEWKDGRMDKWIDGRKIGRLYHTLLKQVLQQSHDKMYLNFTSE